MKNLIQKLLLGLFPFILPLPIPLKYSSIALILFCLGLISYGENNFKNNFKNSFVIIFLLLFFTDTIGNILRLDTSTPFFQDIKLSFLFIPILFISNTQIIKNNLKIILSCFVLGTIMYIIHAWWFVFDFYFITAPNYRPSFSFGDHYIPYMLYNYLPQAIHHTYIGIYIIFSIFILIHKISNDKKNHLLKGFTILLLFSSLFYIGGKSSLILLFILFTTYFLTIKKKAINITFTIIFLFGLYLVKERIIGLSTENSFFSRLEYLKCSINIICNYWLAGVGALNFNETSKLLCNTEVFIPHNMYLRSFVTNGIFSFLILISIIVLIFRDSIKTKKLLYISLIIILTVGGLTEDLLYLQRGTLFFIFFIFIFHSAYKPEIAT